MNIDLFHALEGEKVRFKPVKLEDVRAIHRYASDAEVSRFIGWNLMRTPEETFKHVEEMMARERLGTHLYASIVQKSTQTIIGTGILFNFSQPSNQAEIGYVFHKDYWGNGYGTESVALISDFAFHTLKLHRLHASVADANIGSARILEKNGFTLEGRLRDYYLIDERYYDALLFGKISNN